MDVALKTQGIKQSSVETWLLFAPPPIKISGYVSVSNPRAACGAVDGFMRHRLGFRCSKSMLYTDNLSLF